VQIVETAILYFKLEMLKIIKLTFIIHVCALYCAGQKASYVRETREFKLKKVMLDFILQKFVTEFRERSEKVRWNVRCLRDSDKTY